MWGSWKGGGGSDGIRGEGAGRRRRSDCGSFPEGSRLLLLGETLHILQLVHWFPLLVDGEELQQNAKNTKLRFAPT